MHATGNGKNEFLIKESLAEKHISRRSLGRIKNTNSTPITYSYYRRIEFS